MNASAISTAITRVSATPISFPIPPRYQVALGIGKTVKRDAVLVRVDTADGVTGWGEAHAARAPTAIAELINTTLADLVRGMDATDTDAVWERVYRMQLASHGAGAAAVIGLSGIDLALWDIRGRLAGQPLCRLLGAQPQSVQAYAGGIALGFTPPPALVEEVQQLRAAGYQAVKLRLGDTPARDIERVRAVRAACGDELEILTDANTAYSVKDVAVVAEALAECRVGWLEEPFPAHDFMSYRAAAQQPGVPLAAGENHYTRFDFERLAADGAVRIWQPDLSKTGGLTEGLRIARMADELGIRIHPHTSLTALNMAASLHYLAAIPNGGWFEADTSRYNPLRDHIGCALASAGKPGWFIAPDAPGIGFEIDPAVCARFPVITGAGYV